MSQRLLTIVLILVVIGGFVGLKAQSPDTSAMLSQLQQISQTQKSIEERISAIELKQSGMLSMIQNARAFPQQPQVAQPPQPPRPPQEDVNKVYEISVGNSLVKGDKDGKVTIVEFSDFQCPFSARFHPVINEVLKAYPKGVKFIYKNFPLSFHPQAEPAARASLAAREQGKYWEMVDLLYQNQQTLGEETYKKLAQQLGLNVEKFMKDYNDPKMKEHIQQDMNEAQTAEVRGTPTFYLNGKRTNARDLAGYKAEIDQVLAGGK